MNAFQFNPQQFAPLKESHLLAPKLENVNNKPSLVPQKSPPHPSLPSPLALQANISPFARKGLGSPLRSSTEDDTDEYDYLHPSKSVKLHTDPPSFPEKSGIAALEAFQREYLSSPQHHLTGGPSPIHLPPSILPPPSPKLSSPGLEALPQSSTFEEQFKELYEFNNDPKRKDFLDDLFSFMNQRGTPINRLPIMAKQVLDLYELYNLVVEKGGLVEVINKKLWQEVIRGLNLPSSITSAAFTLRSQYTRYLYPYECRNKNLSSPSDLHSAIESHRREGRRQAYEGFSGFIPTSSCFPLPPSPLQIPLPQFPHLQQQRPKMFEDPLIGRPFSPGLNQMDMTRIALMKMMGQTRLPFPPRPLNLAPCKREEDFEQNQEEEEDRRDEREKPVNGQKPEDQSEKLVGSGENSMVVSMELNSITYQGVLFAQPIATNRG